MSANNLVSLPAVVLFAGALAGCSGGGGGNNSPAPNPGPNGGVTGDTFAITSSNRLVGFNRATPTSATIASITGLRANENLLAFDLRPGGTPAGQLYAIGSLGGVYTIDPSSGAATMKATMTADPSDTTMPFTGFQGTRVSIDVNNLVDQLRVITDTGQNIRVMLDTGATFTDTPMTQGGQPAIGLTEVGYTNNFGTACRTTVYYLDTTADRLATSVNASLGVVTPVGSLTVDASAMAGFDIITAADGTTTALAALTVNNTTSLYTINLSTGAATVAGGINGLNAGESILGLAGSMPASTPIQPLGELVALTDANNIVSFNSAFPPKLCTTAPVSGLQGGEQVLGIDVRPADGNLYALTSNARLYTVNPANGAASLKSTLAAAAGDDLPYTGLQGTNFAVDVSPAADGLRVLGDQGQNLRINMDTGATITDAVLNPPGSSVTSAAYTNSFAGTAMAKLYVLDTQNDRLMIQGQPSGSPINGDLQAVGPLAVGSDVGPIGAFEINAVNNTAVAALNVNGAATSDLYTINLMTGAASRVNTIGGGARIRGLTYAASLRAVVLGATTDGRLISFAPNAPGTILSNNAITGMQGGERILGFDIRPSNRILYILSDAGRVYTVDPGSAVATLLSTLTPAPGSTFTQLIGTAFGVDFSPTADAMRVITDAEQNLAVLVDPGQVIVATALRRVTAESASPAPDVVSIAYTQNYAGTTDTTLYDIDMATNSLLSQKPANNGLVTTIGRLDPTLTFSRVSGFDIVGGDDGLVLAALQPTGSTQPTLYRVNLMTGAVAAVGPIGMSTTQGLVGLTIRLQ